MFSNRAINACELRTPDGRNNQSGKPLKQFHKKRDSKKEWIATCMYVRTVQELTKRTHIRNHWQYKHRGRARRLCLLYSKERLPTILPHDFYTKFSETSLERSTVRRTKFFLMIAASPMQRRDILHEMQLKLVQNLHIIRRRTRRNSMNCCP